MSILRVSNVFSSPERARKNAINEQDYMSNYSVGFLLLKNNFLLDILKDFHEFGVVSSQLFQVKREQKKQDLF